MSKVVVTEASNYAVIVGNNWMKKTRAQLDWESCELMIRNGDRKIRILTEYCKPANIGDRIIRKSQERHNESEYILKEGVEIREAYLGEEKGARVKKYNLGKMSQEQQGRMRQILQKYKDIFANLIIDTYPVEDISDEHYDTLLLARALRVVNYLFEAQIKAYENIQKSQQEQKWRHNQQHPLRSFEIGKKDKKKMESRFEELKKILQPLGNKLSKNEELEIKERRVIFKCEGQMLEETIKKSRENKAQQIYKNMVLYLQDLNQNTEIEPIMSIKTIDRTWEES
ncbi:30363_t:CDS:2 [Gigaspora margarita]|uniref:30363_t:CDS:1 n=1 Tax=Gigaspora margarita TaxID=4874 RepID=A0ABM8VYB9_GIGMA|nr:30363_t:CDS:2 [Gigaspora margarita]